ncbi:MAG: hypothetical protein KGL46_00710 [Hyphomicrobiales bacterium]|nr:hypothetical protein [Hyphomicrobiales bacterium]
MRNVFIGVNARWAAGVAGTFRTGSNPIMVGAAVTSLFFSAGNSSDSIDAEARQTEAEAPNALERGDDHPKWPVHPSAGTILAPAIGRR